MDWNEDGQAGGSTAVDCCPRDGGSASPRQNIQHNNFVSVVLVRKEKKGPIGNKTERAPFLLSCTKNIILNRDFTKERFSQIKFLCYILFGPSTFLVCTLLCCASSDEVRVYSRASNEPSRGLKLYYHGEGPYFSWLKAATTAFTFKNILRHIFSIVS